MVGEGNKCCLPASLSPILTMFATLSTACSVQSDLDLHCPQKLSVSQSVKKEFIWTMLKLCPVVQCEMMTIMCSRFWRWPKELNLVLFEILFKDTKESIKILVAPVCYKIIQI